MNEKEFLDNLQDEIGKIVAKRIKKYVKGDKTKSENIDNILGYRTDGSFADEGGFSGFGFANFAYEYYAKTKKK
jgi:hypothetical protein